MSDRLDAAIQQFCSLCFDPILGGNTDKTLRHVMDEHRDSEEFQEFVDDIRVTTHCQKCGERFMSEVEAFSDVFGAQPYCPECREKNRALRDLMTEHYTIRELIDRGHIHGECHA